MSSTVSALPSAYLRHVISYSPLLQLLPTATLTTSLFLAHSTHLHLKASATAVCGAWNTLPPSSLSEAHPYLSVKLWTAPTPALPLPVRVLSLFP